VGEHREGRVGHPVDDDDMPNLARRGLARRRGARRGERDSGGQKNREQSNKADRPDHQVSILTEER
jgi:hypothetical protein